MFLTLFLLLSGFVLLIIGADYLVKGASALARKYRVSELAIGLTIVAFGTSAPELMVSVVSSLEGYNEVVYGNVIGSNIFNLFFILGIAGLIYPINVQHQSVWKEIPYSFLAALLLIFLVNDYFFWKTENLFSRVDSFILLIFFFAFLYYVSKNLKTEAATEEMVQKPAKDYKLHFVILMVLGGLAGLIIGGRMVVENAILIARILNITENLIGLTIIAAGTSLPELATSAVAALRKNSEIAIGNILGSNIFNILFILPVSGLINPMPFSGVLNTDIVILMMGTILLFINMFSGKIRKLDRWEAALLLMAYLGYVYYLVIRE